MIIKPLKPPFELLQMEALNERLPLHHPQKDAIDLRSRNIRAGYNGERSLQFPLSFLPEEEYWILHQLRLPDANGAFQMDLLLLSARYLLIAEVKNVRSQVVFDEMGQTIRIDEGKEEAFTNPVQQVKLQHRRLLEWMRKSDFPAVPIEKIVVYTNSSTVLKNQTNQKELSRLVIRKDRLLDKIEEFENKHRSIYLEENDLMEISTRLLQEDTPKKENVREKYNISPDELIKGVSCPDCSRAPMVRKNGKWCCSYCGRTSKTAHRRALMHYGILISEYINNRQARAWLRVDSRHIVKQLLQKEEMHFFGTSSGRRYKIEFNELMRNS